MFMSADLLGVVYEFQGSLKLERLLHTLILDEAKGLGNLCSKKIT